MRTRKNDACSRFRTGVEEPFEANTGKHAAVICRFLFDTGSLEHELVDEKTDEDCYKCNATQKPITGNCNIRVFCDSLCLESLQQHKKR